MEQAKRPGRPRKRKGAYQPLRTDIRIDLAEFLKSLPGSLRENIEEAVLLLKKCRKQEQ